MSYEYEIEIDIPAYIDPNLVKRRTREVIKRILEKYGVFAIEVDATAGRRRREEEVIEEI